MSGITSEREVREASQAIIVSYPMGKHFYLLPIFLLLLAMHMLLREWIGLPYYTYWIVIAAYSPFLYLTWRSLKASYFLRLDGTALVMEGERRIEIGRIDKVELGQSGYLTIYTKKDAKPLRRILTLYMKERPNVEAENLLREWTGTHGIPFRKAY